MLEFRENSLSFTRSELLNMRYFNGETNTEILSDTAFSILRAFLFYLYFYFISFNYSDTKFWYISLAYSIVNEL